MKLSHTVRRAGTVSALAVAIASGPILASASFAAPHHPSLSATISAHPTAILADGKSTTTISVKLFHGHAARKAAVTLATADVPSGGGSCGTLTATSGATGHNGMFRTTYTSSSVVGFCTVTVTSGTATASVTIDQKDPTLAAALTVYSIAASAKPTHLKANGTSTSTITVTVTNGTSAVPGDAIWIGERALRPGACGTVARGAATTDSNGQVTATYTSSTKAGNCLLRAREASTAAASGAIVIHQGR
jgi:adhesin/invasin